MGYDAGTTPRGRSAPARAAPPPGQGCPVTGGWLVLAWAGLVLAAVMVTAAALVAAGLGWEVWKHRRRRAVTFGPLLTRPAPGEQLGPDLERIP